MALNPTNLPTVTQHSGTDNNFQNFKTPDGSARPNPLSNQATYNQPVAAGAGNTVCSAHAGRLASIQICTTGGASATSYLSFYDNATTSGSSPIFGIAGNVAVGTIYTVNIPVANGITVSNVTSGPAFSVNFD